MGCPYLTMRMNGEIVWIILKKEYRQYGMPKQ